MCHAITKSGKVCKIKTTNHFCHIHATGATGATGAKVTPIDNGEREMFALEKEEEDLDAKIRDEILQNLFKPNMHPFGLNMYQRQAWPLFKYIDLTTETLDIIKRAKYVSNWNEETYNTIISTYFDDGIPKDEKYELIKQKIGEGIQKTVSKDPLKNIQRMDLYKDIIILCTKVALSKGVFWDDIEKARLIVTASSKLRNTDINEYRENNLNKLRVNITKKQTPICDDVCNYIIAQYL
jgi:hypothetical protein